MKKNTEQKKIANLEIGERFHLIDIDHGTDCVAALKNGGKSGGSKYDIYAAYVGDENDITDDMVTIRISQIEADELEIAL